ncbi:MAG: FG-GAP-like repeat-containing protein, partial [Saprospiraceae bacterium]
PSNSNGAAYADLDNDGDLDLVINNINQPAFIMQNESQKENDNHYLQLKLEGEAGNTQGIGARVRLFAGDQQQRLEQYASRGYLSSVSPVLHFGLGTATKIDRLLITWNNGKSQELTDVSADQLLVLKETDASASSASVGLTASNALFSKITTPVAHTDPILTFRDFDRQPLLMSELSYDGPVMAAADVNQDDLEDLFIGGTVGQSGTLYLQQRNGKFSPVSTPDLEADRFSDDAAAVFFDANGDSYPDLYVGSGGYHDLQADDPRLQDRLYLNDGSGHFTRAGGALPDRYTSTGAVAVQDINGDGNSDLFIGGRLVPGRYPESPGSYLLINDGMGHFSDQTGPMAPELQELGMVTDAIWTDMNADGTAELVVVGEWMPITVYGLDNGRLVNKTTEYFDREFKGLWHTVAVGDFNGDQRPDLIVGNIGNNTQFQVSAEEPAELFYKDFDGNGSVDPIFCYYIQGKSYPYVTRDEMLGQLSGLRSRYTTFESYANAGIGDIFASEELRGAGHLEADYMKTAMFLSGADGRLQVAGLPPEAQYAPVYTIAVLDADGDGIDDILLCGNNSHAKLRLGKLDANYGVLLRGDGTGGFAYVPQPESGFQLRGDVRSVIKIDDTLLFGINEGKVECYKINNRVQ